MNEQARMTQMLHLDVEPVGVFFACEAPADFEPGPDTRNCAATLLLASAKGKTIALTEETCNCAGGAVGLCFGDGFARLNPRICDMLSQGLGDAAPQGARPMLVEGERFFQTREAAERWRSSLPISACAYPRVVFAPLSRWAEIGAPDVVFVFAAPDALSAMVAMLGSHSGRACNVVAPMCAACQSIMFAAAETGKDEPSAIMGLFDLSQRRAAVAGYLSLTMPYALWEGMSDGLDKSCLTTHSWRKIEERLN